MKAKVVIDSGSDEGHKEWVLKVLDKTLEKHRNLVPEEQCNAESFSMIPLAAVAVIQEIFLEHADAFTREEHSRLSNGFMLLAASINTFGHNPLFGSYAVLDQLKHHVEVIMSGKKGFAVVADEDEEDDEAEDSRH